MGKVVPCLLSQTLQMRHGVVAFIRKVFRSQSLLNIRCRINTTPHPDSGGNLQGRTSYCGNAP